MAKKKASKQEVSRVESNGAIFIKYDDGSMTIIPASIDLTEDDVIALFSEEGEETEEDEDEEDEEPAPKKKGKKAPVEEEEDEDEDDEEEEDEEETDEDEELTPEQLAEMDFEECEALCDDNDLETDPDEFDDEDVDALRQAIAKELGIKLPKKPAKKGKK